MNKISPQREGVSSIQTARELLPNLEETARWHGMTLKDLNAHIADGTDSGQGRFGQTERERQQYRCR